MLKDLEKINRIFRLYSEKIVKFRIPVILGTIIIFAIAVFGIMQLEVNNSMEDWLTEGNRIRIANDQFEETFGNPEMVAVLIEAPDIFDPKVLTFLKDFGTDLENDIPFADEVTSIVNVEYSYSDESEIYIENLIPDDIPEDEEELKIIREKALSKDFLVNRIFTDDFSQTWVTMTLEPFPDTKEWHKEHGVDPAVSVGNAVFKLINEKYSPDKLPEGCTIKPSGLPVIAAEETAFYGREGVRVLLLALIAAFVILILVLRSFSGVIIPLITTILSLSLVFGFMGLLRIKLNQQLMTLPIYLGLAVSIGYSIHLFNFFKRHMALTDKRKESVCYAVEHTGWPIFFTALTTIGSLLSFIFIPIIPIKWLGITSACIILSVYVIVMTLTPVLLSFNMTPFFLRPLVKKLKRKRNVEVTQHKVMQTDAFFTHLGKHIMRHPVLIIVCFIIVAGVCIFGITKVRVNMDYKRSVGLRVPYVNRLNYIGESKIGSMMSYNITFTFDEENAIKNPDVLKRFEKVAEEVGKFKLTKRVSSILDILKDMNMLFHESDPSFYRVPNEIEEIVTEEYSMVDGKEVVTEVIKEVPGKDQIANLMFLYEMSGGENADDWTDDDYKILRLFVEAYDYDNQEMVTEFEKLQKLAAQYFPDAQFQASGELTQFLELNSLIATGELQSFFTALIVIMFLMMIVFRSIKAGLIGMIPNITPAIIVGGFMGFFDIPLDMYTMTIMPMLLGLAVDDTIHFITHTKLEYQRTGSYNHAILETFKTVGKAIFMTSFIIIVTFSMYFTSIVNIFINLGLFVLFGISSALISDYLMTPVLVKFFKPFGPDHMK